MKLTKTGLAVVLALAFVIGAVAAKAALTVKIITHFLYYDLDKKDFAAYESGKDVQVYVLEESGVEPATVVAESGDGSKILIAPSDIAEALLKEEPADPKSAPSPQSYPNDGSIDPSAPKSVPPDQYKYGQSLTSY